MNGRIIKKTVLLAALFFLTTLLGISNVKAALIDVDWQTSGDAGITYDSSSGLEWLDLTYAYTGSLSSMYDALDGGQFAGWRIANESEIISLIVDAYGLPYNSWVSREPEAFAAADLLVATMGGNGTGYYLQNNHIVLGNLLHSGIVVFEAIPQDLQDPFTNEFFLVRDASAVPIPASILLLGSSLGGLLCVRRYKR